MQKTVKEIIEMINSGELHYNQSTQRKFVYASMPAKLDRGGETTKAGSLINAILEDNIQLPAVYFWHNTETGQTNIHDGKQRILSLYYFINRQAGIEITTYRNTKQTNWDGLTEEDQDKLLNYTFDVVERSGNNKDEERSFFLINTNAVPLTNYECVAGQHHGTFLTGFEKYIESKSKILNSVKQIDRGAQAYKFLLALFNLTDYKKAASENDTLLNLNEALRKVRGNVFDAEAYSFNAILDVFNDISTIVKGIKEDRALSIASYVVRNNYDKNIICDYYRQSMREINDIDKWDIATHKTFIDAFMQGLTLDPKRNFDKDIKDRLYASCPRCSNIDENGNMCKESNYSKLEVDHIIPWSKGGRTILDNAQLLCKSHNASKGNRT